ncbi:hypothetical protein [Amycolatopsis kentuckyensis]|uniref:hypothetical protein n=1 Tax=Amycolatopsis kentuckyensis TaxID=218823 RepID=UPI000A3C85F3|nr:hypothetical protein [Amycolatopsis kentuckyensis]
MPRFKSLSSDDLSVFRPVGEHDAFPVTSEAPEIEVPGDVTEETEDAYIVGAGDEARAWPKATWVLVAPEKKPVKAEKEN